MQELSAIAISMTASNIVLITTVKTQSVASASPGALLHGGGPWTPPETRFSSAGCSQGKRAALVKQVRPQPSCLATGEAKYQRSAMGHDKDLMRPIYLHNIRKFNSCLAVNTLLSVTKVSWLMLFITVIAVYCRSHRKA